MVPFGISVSWIASDCGSPSLKKKKIHVKKKLNWHVSCHNVTVKLTNVLLLLLSSHFWFCKSIIGQTNQIISNCVYSKSISLCSPHHLEDGEEKGLAGDWLYTCSSRYYFPTAWCCCLKGTLTARGCVLGGVLLKSRK